MLGCSLTIVLLLAAESELQLGCHAGAVQPAGDGGFA